MGKKKLLKVGEETGNPKKEQTKELSNIEILDSLVESTLTLSKFNSEEDLLISLSNIIFDKVKVGAVYLNKYDNQNSETEYEVFSGNSEIRDTVAPMLKRSTLAKKSFETNINETILAKQVRFRKGSISEITSGEVDNEFAFRLQKQLKIEIIYRFTISIFESKLVSVFVFARENIDNNILCFISALIFQAKVLLCKFHESGSENGKFEKIFQLTPDSVVILDSAGTITDCNDNVINLMGFKEKNDILKRNFSEFIISDKNVNINYILKKIINSGSVFDHPLKLVNSSGEEYYAEVSGGLLTNNYHNYEYILVIRDVTKKFVYEKMLVESERQLKEVQKIGHIGSWEWDKKSDTIIWSEELHRILGGESDIMMGKAYEVINFSHPDDREEILNSFDALKSGTSFISKDVKIINVDGDIRFVRLIGKSIKDFTGEVIKIIGTCEDITERTRNLKKLHSSEEKFRTLVDRLPLGVYKTSFDGEILFANKAVAKILGFENMEDLYRTNVKESFSNPKEREKLVDLARSGVNKISSENIVYNYCNKKIYLKDDAIVTFDETGIPAYFEGILEDITERKKTEAELISAKEKAEESEKLITNFLASMSHELRTPLIGILGYSQIISEEYENIPSLCKMSDGIHNSGLRLLETLNLILEYSRIEAGKLKLCISEVYPDKIVDEVIGNFRPIARNKNISLSKISSMEDLKISSDKRVIREIINNLVNNAVKYTDIGFVKIELKHI